MFWRDITFFSVKDKASVIITILMWYCIHSVQGYRTLHLHCTTSTRSPLTSDWEQPTWFTTSYCRGTTGRLCSKGDPGVASVKGSFCYWWRMQYFQVSNYSAVSSSLLAISTVHHLWGTPALKLWCCNSEENACCAMKNVADFWMERLYHNIPTTRSPCTDCMCNFIITNTQQVKLGSQLLWHELYSRGMCEDDILRQYWEFSLPGHPPTTTVIRPYEKILWPWKNLSWNFDGFTFSIQLSA